MSGQIIGPIGVLPTGGAGGFSIYTFQASPAPQNSPGTSTVTFSSVAVGTAASNRVVVLTLTSSAQIATAILVNSSISMTKAIEESSIVSSLQIWYATVPTGTTANFDISFGGNPSDVAIVTGNFNSGTSAIPTTTSAAAPGTASSLAENITIPTGGFAVAAMAVNQPNTLTSWTNTTLSGGDSTTNCTLTNLYTSNSITVGSPTTITAAVSSTVQLHMVGAAWGP